MQPIHLQYRTACFLLFALLHFSDAQQRDSTPVPQFMNVTDGPGLQAALKAGVKHIIVRRHLNLESLPVTDKEGAEFNAGVAPFTGTTMSLTGDCRQESNSGGKRACTLNFKEDGIEVFPTSQHVYLADLDLKVVPGKRDHAGLLLVRGGDVWLKNVTFSGAGESCRAIDILGNARLFMTDGKISNFEEDKTAIGAGVRARANAFAAFQRTTFSGNIISASKSSSSALPGGAAYAENGAAISLSASSVDGNTASSHSQPLAVQSSKGSIYADGRPTQVHDLSSGTTVKSSAPAAGLQPSLTGQEQWLLQTQSVIERYVVGESAAPPAQPMQQPPAPPGPPQLAPTPPRRAMPGAAPPDLPAASQSDGKDKSHGRLVRVVTIIAAASVFVGLLVGAAICLMRGCITSRSRSATCAHLRSTMLQSELPSSVKGYSQSGHSQSLPGTVVGSRYTPSVTSAASSIASKSNPRSSRGQPSKPPLPPPPPLRTLTGTAPYVPPWPREVEHARSSSNNHCVVAPFTPEESASLSVLAANSSSHPSLAVVPPSMSLTAPTTVPGISQPRLQSASMAFSYGSVGPHEALAAAANKAFGIPRSPPLPEASEAQASVIASVARQAAAAAEDPVPSSAAATHGDGGSLEDALGSFVAARALFLGRFELGGPDERRHGGQGVVQFVRDVITGDLFAIKFFTHRAAFERERALYQMAALRSIMPALSEVVSNDDASVSAPDGYVLPPCIVVERGEALDEWAARIEPGFPTILNVLCDIATRLLQLHACGLAHRDLKPANILWRPQHHSWTLIDFGCAARIGTSPGLSFSLHYAPPEIVAAVEAKEKVALASTATDMWALGVVAFELLTRTRAFQPRMPTSAIRDQLVGRKPLPWEGKDRGKRRALLRQLRILKPSVMACLSRQPEERPSAEELLRNWNRLFDHVTAATSPTVSASIK